MRWMIASYLALLGCAEEETQPADVEFPTFLSFQSKVIARSCSPNPGVCHQSNNYPDLRTPAAMLGILGAPCNIAIPDPKQGWDACEPAPDRLRTETFASDIAWKKRLSTARWRLGLRDPAPRTATVTPSLVAHEGDYLLEAEEELGVKVALTAGSNEAIVFALDLGEEGFGEYLDAIVSTVAGGDPNQNGLWGFGDPSVQAGALIVPGSLSRSYLWGRLNGTVPGTRMPLANQPLSEPEFRALACWIEGVDPENASVDDPIDYASCSFTSVSAAR